MSFSIIGHSQTAGMSCSSTEPACTLPSFNATSSGNSAPELVGNNISNPSTNPNPLPGNSGCSFSDGISPNWVSISVVSDGVLEFTLGQAGGNGFFDWVMWQNTDGNACNDIVNNVLPPIACNWNASNGGFSGMTEQGCLPPGADQGNFEFALNVMAGDQFILMFSNYSGIDPLNVALDFDPTPNCGSSTTSEISCTPLAIPEQIICQGDSAFVHVPLVNNAGTDLNITSYSWSPNTNIDNPNGGPDVAIFPNDSTWYFVTLTSPDSTWLDSVRINVVQVITPYAGVDDSLCFSTTAGYQFNPVISNVNNTITWEFLTGPPNTTPPSSSTFQPDENVPNTTVLTNIPGQYQYVLHETDLTGTCPDGTDTISILFSEESHDFTFTNPSCYESNDGNIQITTTGTLGAILYGFNGSPVNTVSDTVGLEPGIYTLISEDILGCTAISTVTLTEPPEVTLTLTPQPDSTICENGTATLQANATNGNTFIYHWSQTNDISPIQVTNPTSDFSASVYAENEMGCFSETLSTTIHVNPPISINQFTNDTICPGEEISFVITANGGDGNYTYTWSENGNPYNNPNNEVTISPTIPTSFCVIVTDACESIPKNTCVDIFMREIPQPLFAVDTTDACVDSEIIFYDITQYNLPNTQTEQAFWVIDGVTYNSDSIKHLFKEPGLYGVIFEIYTQFGCHNQINISDYITIYDKPYPNIYITPNPTTIFHTEIDMINYTEGDSNQYQWSFPGGLPNSSNSYNQTVLYQEGIAGEYPVNLIVTNEHNCIDSTSDMVHIISDVLIYAPNTFTPDGDQKNNTWRVYVDGIDIYDFHLLIYNRWGEIVWESYDPEGIWDGTYGSTPVKDGTYAWRVIMKEFNTDKRHDIRGTVNVLR